MYVHLSSSKGGPYQRFDFNWGLYLSFIEFVVAYIRDTLFIFGKVRKNAAGGKDSHDSCTTTFLQHVDLRTSHALHHIVGSVTIYIQ